MGRLVTLDDLIHEQGLAVLITWIRRQIDEDERVALACPGPVWTLDGSAIIDGHPTDEIVSYVREQPGQHIERWDPERALAEVKGKRLILDELEHALAAQPVLVEGHCPLLVDEGLAADLVRILTAPYSDVSGWIDLDRGAV